MLDNILFQIKKFIPRNIFDFFSPAYHWTLSLFASIVYRFPSKHIKIITITGTKGKSSTTEIINAIFEKAGYKTALSNTIRFKIGEESSKNLYKMSTPGRFFLQRFIRKAVNAKCDYCILEISSQASMLFRHKFIHLDTFIFTNLSREHIEAHGSYENYREAKVDIARNLNTSCKDVKTVIVNGDDKEHVHFTEVNANQKIIYTLQSLKPYSFANGIDFTYKGTNIHSHLVGEFNLSNILAAITCADCENISKENIKEAIEQFKNIPGRLETINAKEFDIIVDYAHTVESLQMVYEIYKHTPIIAVLGGTGGGRDIWKRTEMGKIADTYCKEIILTNEDPYDEDPQEIFSDIIKGIKNHNPIIILDRRDAIRKAIEIASPGSTIIITGKGTDPYIMGPNNSKIPWSDSKVVKEELEKFYQASNK